MSSIINQGISVGLSAQQGPQPGGYSGAECPDFAAGYHSRSKMVERCGIRGRGDRDVRP